MTKIIIEIEILELPKVLLEPFKGAIENALRIQLQKSGLKTGSGKVSIVD